MRARGQGHVATPSRFLAEYAVAAPDRAGGHPAVQEACVIAAKDAYRGETVKAFVVLREEARGTVSEAAIIAWASQHMAAYKYPRLVSIVDTLPKSATGKVLFVANVMVPLLAPRALRGGEWAKTLEAKAMDALEFVGISDLALESASALSQGDLKRLEVAPRHRR